MISIMIIQYAYYPILALWYVLRRMGGGVTGQCGMLVKYITI